jgi:hypothetical protein
MTTVGDQGHASRGLDPDVTLPNGILVAGLNHGFQNGRRFTGFGERDQSR